MGAGKTTVGKGLATKLGKAFFDSDSVIEERTGVDIGYIFELEGEEGFRKREMKIIEELTAKSGIVLATGGGSILAPENRNFLAARGVVVYLECTLEQQYERTIRDKNRPLLKTDDPKKKLEEIFAIREPLYKATADTIVPSSQRNVRRTTTIILDEIEALNG